MANDGWFYSEESRVLNGDNRPTGEPNVSAKFDDHQLIDGAKSRVVRRNVYRTGIVCRSKVELNAAGGMSSDASSHVLKFDAYPDEAEKLLRRFPDAWKDYLKRRKAPEQPGEVEFYDERRFQLDMMPKVKAKATKKAA